MRGQFIPVCHNLCMLVIGVRHDSAYLYIVIFSIINAIIALYIVFVLFWLHVSFTVIQARSRKILEI